MTSNATLANLVERSGGLVESIDTEEATKRALIMSFIQALGYNVFDPNDVVPEFTADVGVKSGEKVDYAIMQKGSPVMLFECKYVGNTLDPSSISQLYRYFTATSAHIGVLTNDIIYQLFSDLDESNRMDDRPFLEIDLLNLDERSSSRPSRRQRKPQTAPQELANPVNKVVISDIDIPFFRIVFLLLVWWFAIVIALAIIWFIIIPLVHG